jgi:hypothetical protein
MGERRLPTQTALRPHILILSYTAKTKEIFGIVE